MTHGWEKAGGETVWLPWGVQRAECSGLSGVRSQGMREDV